jgi:hypothetical protein
MLKPEAQLQQAVCQYLTAKRLTYFAIPNGYKKSKFQQWEAKQTGLIAGTPDLFICQPKEGSGGLFLELKVKGGRLQDSQKEMIEKLKNAGYAVGIAWSLDEAITTINEYLK